MISEQDKARIEREAEARYLLDDPKMNMLHDNMSQYAKRDAYIAGATAENLQYQPVVDALEKIANPVKYLQDKAKEEGYHLNGQMAIQLSNDPGWLRQAATDALNQLNAQKYNL